MFNYQAVSPITKYLTTKLSLVGMQLPEKYKEKFKRDTGSCIHAKEIFVIIGTTYTDTDSSIFLMCSPVM
jgi:hypothetical protein